MPKGFGIKHFTFMKTGQIFGSWMILGPHEKRNRVMYWLCSCKCRRTNKFVSGATLRAGRSKQCKLCLIEKNIERQSKPNSAFNQLYGRYRTGAKSRNLEWNLTEDEFRKITSSYCVYTGRKPSAIFKSLGGSYYTYNSIDRVDSSQGYILNNCVACHPLVNRMKGQLPLDEFYTLIQEISNYKRESPSQHGRLINE